MKANLWLNAHSYVGSTKDCRFPPIFDGRPRGLSALPDLGVAALLLRGRQGMRLPVHAHCPSHVCRSLIDTSHVTSSRMVKCTMALDRQVVDRTDREHWRDVSEPVSLNRDSDFRA